MLEITQIQKRLKETLPIKRYEHTLGVAETAEKLGMHYQENVHNLKIAAFLHDSAKFMTQEELLAFCKTNHIILTEEDKKAKGTIHAKAGASIAEKEYQITDTDIIEAIKYHSTGHPAMNRFQKILFLSDYLDPSRNLPGNDALFETAMTDFEEAVFQIIKEKIIYVAEKNQYLHPLSIHFYNIQLELRSESAK
jgi:nicotinate-nucleotide adenylyltransferase